MNAHAHSRRQFVKRAALLPLGGAAALGAFTAEAGVPISRPGGAALKVSLNAYSFNDLLMAYNRDHSRGLSLMALLDYCAKNDFDAIDPTGYYFPGYPRVPDDDYINTFKRTAFEYGLDISGTGVRNNFITPDPAERAAGVRLVKDWVVVAAKLGAPVIRVFCDTQSEGRKWPAAAGGATREQVQAWLVDAVNECVEQGRKYGVIIGVQNHGDFLQTADQLLALIAAVNSDWCGAIVDTGMFVAQDPYAEMAKVAPYAVNWQIKQSLSGAGGEVPTDVLKVVRAVRGAGYRGYLPIETLPSSGRAYDPYAAVPPLLKALREAIAQTAGE